MKEKEIYQGKVFNLVVRTYPFQETTLKREIVDHPPSVTILPKNEEQIILIRQKRRSIGKTLIELPAGTLEPRETPLECAKRELKEETGYCAQQWKKIFATYPTPGYSTEYMHFYVAEQLEKLEADREFGEEISVYPVTVSNIREMINTQQVQDQKTLLAFFWMLSHKNI